MYATLYKEYLGAQNQHKVLLDYKRQSMLKAVDDLVTTMLYRIDDNVAKAYSNQRRLNSELKELYAKLNVFREQADAWCKVVGDFNKSLKELGDVENWASRMERETLILDGCLRLALTNSTKETVYQLPESS
ncbi:Biogenesis of lysosome organelles complex 1 subunit 1 [Fasciolopsis buskii]|uniref:Biogenesis of lysosome-related organelles complex 1 subunit 1 n=1 Tax=Fasciolopsis buskii TaxID=27845 RepID=A0A8E0RNP2_9TREM|nr:Biogenesis of lysosome organelles complex 1 subunit 1 [Fasciolopsis buski]